MNRLWIRPALACAMFVVFASGLPAQDDSGLRVTRSGVGTDVEDRELVGEADRFEEGSSVVFWTRVEGGEAGDTVQHVWLHEGEEAVTIVLNIGGPSWRTWSRKSLHGGASAGNWTVEARDSEGRVLATATFTCVAGEPSGD
jgi:hypothetical protein